MDVVERVRRYHAALNAYSRAVIEPLFAPDAEYHSPGVGVKRGRDEIMAAMDGYFTEYPDQVAVDDTIAALDERRVVCRWQLTATSRSTGEAMSRTGDETVTFDSEGRIIRIDVADR